MTYLGIGPTRQPGAVIFDSGWGFLSLGHRVPVLALLQLTPCCLHKSPESEQASGRLQTHKFPRNLSSTVGNLKQTNNNNYINIKEHVSGLHIIPICSTPEAAAAMNQSGKLYWKPASEPQRCFGEAEAECSSSRRDPALLGQHSLTLGLLLQQETPGMTLGQPRKNSGIPQHPGTARGDEGTLPGAIVSAAPQPAPDEDP